LNYYVVNIKQYYCRSFSSDSNHFFAALLNAFFVTAFISLKIVNFFLMLSEMLKKRQAN